MTMRKKSTTLFTTAVSVVLTSCASIPISTPVQATDPVIANSMPTPEEIYAQRFKTSVVQVESEGKSRFVICRDGCQGATPKTIRGRINALLTQRLRNISREHTESSVTAASLASVPSVASTVTAPVANSIDVPGNRTIDDADNSGVVDDYSQEHSNVDGLSDAQIEELMFVGEPMDVIHFRQGSAILDSASIETISSIANAWSFSGSTTFPLLIAGFTSSSTEQSIKFNRVLALKRAEAVRDALLAHGVPRNALRVIAHSRCCNVEERSTERGRAKNRRTEIHVLTSSS